MKVSTDTRVGVFFLVGLVILGVVTFQVEDLGGLFAKKVIMKTRVHHAAGLKEGDMVAMAGLKVGEVKEIHIRDNMVEVTMGLEDGVPVREDSVVKIAWGGLLGNRYIDMTLGSPEKPVLKPGAYVPSVEALRLDEIFMKVDKAAGNIQETFAENELGQNFRRLIDNAARISEKMVSGEGTIGKLINDPGLYDNLKSTAAQIKSGEGTLGKLIYSDELHKQALAVVADLKSASARMEKLLADNDGRIENIIKGLEAAAPEAKDAFTTIKDLGKKIDAGEGILPALINDKEMRKNLEHALARLSSSLDKIDEFTTGLKEGKGLAAKLVNDEEFAKTFEAAGKDFQETARSLRAIAERIETGDNTVARLTRDSDLYEDVKKVLADTRETLRRVREQIPVGTFTSVLLSAF